MNVIPFLFYFLCLAALLVWFLLANRTKRAFVPGALLLFTLVAGIVLFRVAARNVPSLCTSNECVARVVGVIDLAVYFILASTLVVGCLLAGHWFRSKKP